MSRGLRESAPFSIYHVMARGNNREPLFLSRQDRETYLRLWRKYKDKLEFDVLAYTLMTNHVHWLVRVGRIPLSTIILTIHSLYARTFNQIHQRVGHVFQGRFRSEICNDESYLMSLCRYIHRNPLEAGLAKNLLDYEWSSYRDICGLRSDPLVNRQFLLGFFGQKRPVEKFCRLVDSEDSEQQLVVDVATEPIQTNVTTTPEESRLNLSELAEIVINRFNISLDDLIGRSRLPLYVEARKIFIKEAVKQHAYRKSEVAYFLNRNRSLITKVLSED